jgi:hypothetical protein
MDKNRHNGDSSYGGTSMLEVRCIKVLNQIPNCKDPDEIMGYEHFETLEVEEFPYSGKLAVIALVRVDPQFYGAFTLRFPEDTPYYHEFGICNPKNEFSMNIINCDEVPVTFSKPGTYYAALALDGKIIHRTPVKVFKKH